MQRYLLAGTQVRQQDGTKPSVPQIECRDEQTAADVAMLLALQQLKWARLVSYLHWDGSRHDVLTAAEQWEIYCLGDGFGDRTSDELKQINSGWDWSHVRDSSVFAVDRMYTRLMEVLAKKMVGFTQSIERPTLSDPTQAEHTKITAPGLVEGIVSDLCYMDEEDLTTAEGNILYRLRQAGYVEKRRSRSH